ncbi:MAG: acyl-CoA/acyl-ACP dehydrogenase [Pseudomonadota bacterium]|nr:acyl-CoA/acyl-ACP dehydrogenase [Pseudomonadota bacterium]
MAAQNAASVDSGARFPTETLAALRTAGLLSAAVPANLGGAGCNLRQLAEICAAVAQGCGSSGMVLAMHYIQVACIARHHAGSLALTGYLQELVEKQYLLASMTSEVGTSGDTRSSVCAVERKDGRFVLNKDATTGSYCAHADAILVTARRNADAPANDQVLVLVKTGDYKLEQTTDWDTLGMRGTCSPGFRLSSSGDESQILPGPFADSSAQTMVPYSHVLWAALWWGIAADSVARAGAYVRAEARKKPGSVPPTAMRLAEVSGALQGLRHSWQAVADEFDALGEASKAREELLSLGWALKFNNLKVNASSNAPPIVHQVLQIVGILGYKNNSPFSVGRHFRDLLSASLMISNERVKSKSAAMLLVFKDS